jgi:hypothetical protein
MKTTIDIPEEEMDQLLRNTRAKTKKKAVLEAVVDFNRRKRLVRVAKMLGTFHDFITPEELRRMRFEK